MPYLNSTIWLFKYGKIPYSNSSIQLCKGILMPYVCTDTQRSQLQCIINYGDGTWKAFTSSVGYYGLTIRCSLDKLITRTAHGKLSHHQ